MCFKKSTTKDGKEIRLVEKTYRDDGAIYPYDIYAYEYVIQIKWSFIWITIKTYGYNFDTSINNDTIDNELSYIKLLAEEFYEFMINN